MSEDVAQDDVATLRRHLQGFYAECSKVGLPYDAAALVDHHRANAGMASENWKAASREWKKRAEAAESRLAKVDDLLVLWRDSRNPILNSAAGQLRSVVGWRSRPAVSD